MAEVQQETSRGSFNPGPTVLYGTGTISTTLTVATGFAEVHSVQLTYGASGATTIPYATATGGVVTITGDDKAIWYAIAGIL